jgi:hypothetical protein
MSTRVTSRRESSSEQKKMQREIISQRKLNNRKIATYHICPGKTLGMVANGSHWKMVASLSVDVKWFKGLGGLSDNGG